MFSPGEEPWPHELVTDEQLETRLAALRAELREEFDGKVAGLIEAWPKDLRRTASALKIRDLGRRTSAEGPAVDAGRAPAEQTAPPASKAGAWEEGEDEAGTMDQIKFRASRTVNTIDLEDFIIEDAEQTNLEPTVWESAMFIGLPQLGNGGSLLLLCAVMLNIFIQGLFIILIWRAFPSDPVDHEAMVTWRHVVGHHVSQVDAFGYSLVSRVCAFHPTLSVAFGQAALLQEANDYMRDDFDGPLMCFLVIMINFLIWQKEFERTAKVARELWFVPTHSSTRVCHSNPKEWSLETLCKWRKLFMYGMCIVRLLVATMLLWRGTVWLIYTVSITELVLNAVALAFIFDIDELLYVIFAPKMAKALLTRLNIHTETDSDSGARLASYTLRSTSGLTPLQQFRAGLRVVRVALVFAFALLTYFLLLGPNVELVRKVIHETCNGEKNIAIGHHEDLDMVFYANTKSVVSTTNTAPSETVSWQSLDDLIQGRNVSSAKLLDDMATMQTLLAKSASEVGDAVMPSCRDTLPSDFPEFWAKMRSDLGATSASSCQDLKDSCGHFAVHLVRMLCPETCRCFFSKPSSSISKGCPYNKCQDNRASAGYYDTQLSCTDDPVSVLRSDPRWRGYWLSLNNSGDSQRDASFAGVVEYALQNGCAVISNHSMHEEACAEVTNRHSVGTFCPESCDCANNDYWGCPNKCYVSDE